MPSAQAALFHAPGQSFTIESFPIPIPQNGETLVRIRCATICGSDLHTHAGRRHGPTPAVLGHEMVGHIEALSAPSQFAIGDRVTWSMVWSCGHCHYCQSGLHPKCLHLYKFGHAAITPTSHFTGGFAQYCLLPPGTALFQVPTAISDPVASIANCATATVAATFRKAGPIKNKTVLILGAGMLGLNACAMARWLGAESVHAIDINPARREMATRFGATTTATPADLILDFTGAPDAMESALPLLKTGATFILAGAVFPTRPLQIPAELIVRQCLRIEGVHNYSPQDLQTALQFLTETTFPFDTLIEGRYALDQMNEAFAHAAQNQAPRIAIYP